MDAGVEDIGPFLDNACLLGDLDILHPLPTANESLECSFLPTDATEPLFSELGTLPGDFSAVRSLCGMMDPTFGTSDHEDNAQLVEELTRFFLMMADRPAVRRAMAHLGHDTQQRARALADVWLPLNAFEHVFCGNIADDGTVGGQHFWAEYYFAEREGRANYLCSHGGLDDEDVVSIQYTWTPPTETSTRIKPIGGFHVGMSPACLLALGFFAVQAEIPSQGSEMAFQAQVYDKTVDFALLWRNRRLITIFALVQ